MKIYTYTLHMIRLITKPTRNVVIGAMHHQKYLPMQGCYVYVIWSMNIVVFSCDSHASM